jgi:steroid 5-alpha reductase family enzyme
MNEFNNKNKQLVKAYIFCLISYAIAFSISIAIGMIFSYTHPLLMILFADLAATLVIFMFSSVIKNTSLYDPYWSVAPLVIASYYLLFPQVSNTNNLRMIFVFTLVLIWSIRLTYNWLRQWRGLKHEDWRYTKYRVEMGKKFWLINLVGLQLMPTIQVYLGSISLYPTLSLRTNPFGFIDIAAVLITAIAIFLEILADQQLYKFIKTRKNNDKIIINGLWAYSRHPNYFGEILFWWGLYLFAIAADISFYWAIIGPICITVLFNVISIPLMEKRNLARKPDYLHYKKNVSKLIPWFPKKNNKK